MPVGPVMPSNGSDASYSRSHAAIARTSATLGTPATLETAVTPSTEGDFTGRKDTSNSRNTSNSTDANNSGDASSSSKVNSNNSKREKATTAATTEIGGNYIHLKNFLKAKMLKIEHF
jgi:hypothetical protein